MSQVQHLQDLVLQLEGYDCPVVMHGYHVHQPQLGPDSPVQPDVVGKHLWWTRATPNDPVSQVLVLPISQQLVLDHGPAQ